MYLCLDCGKLFETPTHYTEAHGLDAPPYETWMGCPVCGGAYVETMRCEQCGEWITGEYIELNDGQCVCDECYIARDITDVI